MAAGRPAIKPRTEFGQKLYDSRVKKGLSQSYMAELLGLSQQSYAAWERKPTALKPEQLIILAQTFEVSIDELLGLSVKAKRKGGPVGKLQQLFEDASKLPRSQQSKISDLLEPFIDAHSQTS